MKFVRRLQCIGQEMTRMAHEFPLLELEGDAHECGVQYESGAADRVARAIRCDAVCTSRYVRTRESPIRNGRPGACATP